MHTEDERGTSLEGLHLIIPVEPFFGFQYPDCCITLEFNDIIRIIDGLKGVFVIGKVALIEEGRKVFSDWFTLTADLNLGFDDLASISIGHRCDIHLSVADITDLEGLGTFDHVNTIGKVDKLE